MGRVKTFESIVKGRNVPKPGIPESFKVLIRSSSPWPWTSRSWIREGEEIDLRQNFDEDEIWACPTATRICWNLPTWR